jgi:hypothetical protein
MAVTMGSTNAARLKKIKRKEANKRNKIICPGSPG